MKIIFHYLFLLATFPLAARSNQDTQTVDNNKFSLFYTNNELIEQEAKAKKSTKPQHTHKIHLKALFYSSPQTWTLWINDHTISPSEPHPLYKIQRVTPEYVILDWTHQGKIHRIQLRPNQSYDVTLNQILEG
ncbi:MAG: hypothetical protein ACRYGR_06515 [Janthinobacterium lividum]